MDVKPFIVHNMGRVGSGTIYASLLEAGYKAGHVHSLFKPRSDLGREAVRLVKKARDGVFVITPIREPARRNLSAYVANCHREKTPNVKEFLSRYSHDIPMWWFQHEFIPYWHFDPFERPFDRARGWQIYRDHILLIRVTNLDREWASAFHALTGADAPPLVYDNVQCRREYKALIEQIPADYIHQTHQTKYYRHFYGENRGE